MIFWAELIVLYLKLNRIYQLDVLLARDRAKRDL